MHVRSKNSMHIPNSFSFQISSDFNKAFDICLLQISKNEELHHS